MKKRTQFTREDLDKRPDTIILGHTQGKCPYCERKYDNKKIFYIGTSDSISKHKKDIYNTKYGISDFCTNEVEEFRIIKFGICRDIDTRLQYYNKEIPDFRILKTWNINNPKQLESTIKSDFFEVDKDLSEWRWLKNDGVLGLINSIMGHIENTFHPLVRLKAERGIFVRTKHKYIHTHKINK